MDNMTTVPTVSFIDPQYVQIDRKQASKILGISLAELDRRRKSESSCPEGFPATDDKMSKIMFILQDIYDYSALRAQMGRDRAYARKQEDLLKKQAA